MEPNNNYDEDNNIYLCDCGEWSQQPFEDNEGNIVEICPACQKANGWYTKE